MSEPRAVIDVSGLPAEEGFGSKSPVWWGTIGFMVLEGTSIALCLASLLYLRKNFEGYPPPGTAAPDVLIPTVGLLLFFASLYPAVKLHKSAHEKNIQAIKRWTILLLAFEVAIIVIRYFEFDALNTRWDSNAWGSVIWFTMGLHTLLLLGDFGESIFIGRIFFKGPVEKKHFSDAADDVEYWYFLIAAWIPCYVLIYLSQFFL